MVQKDDSGRKDRFPWNRYAQRRVEKSGCEKGTDMAGKESTIKSA